MIDISLLEQFYTFAECGTLSAAAEKLHTSQPALTRAMKKLEERLPGNFMRIHRSYIVNLDKIKEVNKNRIIMDADTYLPIGDNYKEQFSQYLSSRLLGK